MRYRRCCMVTEGPAEVLHGRSGEREALERLLAAVRGGQSRVLVVCGEPRVDKTALNPVGPWLEEARGSYHAGMYQTRSRPVSRSIRATRSRPSPAWTWRAELAD
jgi:hypothetical protein